MLIDAAQTTPQYLPLDLLPAGDDTVIEHAATAQAIELTLRWFEPDVALSDFSVPTLQGMQTLEQLHRLRPGMPLVIVSDEHDERLELEALRYGSVSIACPRTIGRAFSPSSHTH